MSWQFVKTKMIYLQIVLLTAVAFWTAPSVLSGLTALFLSEDAIAASAQPDPSLSNAPAWLADYIAIFGEDLPAKAAKGYYAFLAKVEQEKENRTEHEKAVDYALSAAAGFKTPKALGKDGVFRQNRAAGKKVALTFDDGPVASWTAKYLAVLEKYEAKATFFCQGKQIRANEKEAQAIAASGNELALHSYQHSNLSEKSTEYREADFAKSLQVVEEVTGASVAFFRPPYGAYNKDLIATAKANHLLTCLWSVDPQDWNETDPDVIVQKIMKVVKNGDIILLHEGKKQTYAALPKLLTKLKAAGFELVTMSELLYAGE